MTEALFKRLEATGQLPTLPAVVVRLLDLTQRADVLVREVTETIALDPGLSAKILRFVNSPLAGVARQVTSLQQAVALVGVRGVKMMALSFSVLSSHGGKTCGGFDHKRFAIQSLGCGIAAKVLSETTCNGSSQEAFLAGLLSQIGRSTLAGALPDEYSKVLAAARRIPADLPKLEQAALGGTYTLVGAWLLRKWGIPETLCHAIETFRNLDGSPEEPALAALLHVGELAAGIICPEGRDESPETSLFVEAAERHLKLQAEQCLTAMNEIAGEIERTRELLELPKAGMRSIEQIEVDVRERLAELSMAMHLENQSMAVQQEELLRRATTDALTGVGNRAAFDARMSLELERSARSGTPFALLMIDVDRFKAFNDTYGHQAGDRVLQAVARLLDENIRKVDYVARYGGEEFTVIAPGTAEDGVIHLAERLRQSVEDLSVPWDGRSLSVTISVGVAVFTDLVDAKDACNIIKAADAQLYAAKCAGRNRVELTVAGTPVGVAATKNQTV